MDEIKNFEDFYTIRIQPSLEELNHDESAASNWKRFTYFTAIGMVTCFLLYYVKLLPIGHILAVAMLIMCIVGVYFSARYSDRYTDNFKEKIIGPIITYIYPSAIYKPMGFVSKKEYKSSGLFRRRFTHFDGDDYWESVYNGLSFHCSEVKSWVEDAAGVSYIFKGLFFCARINPSFTGGTYLWAKGNSQLPSSMADEHYRMFPLPQVQRVNTGHEAFNRYYSVYTTSVEEASLILSYHMMDHILLIREKLDREMVLSFVNGKCYIAVPFEENLLEPPRKGLRDKEEIKDYFLTILLVFNIINRLELNRLT
ncbi:MAG TPA: DUF3137 domain-containing protein [Ferruginibacter sp.]|nr:hypothetical protein [Chitinophagaceae bacterium]HRI24238.1 DUF3137 domain-containing protein [Ferruginibacter sp.]